MEKKNKSVDQLNNPSIGSSNYRGAAISRPRWETGIAVPIFKQFFPAISGMKRPQREFYEQWREAWRNGVAIDVNGNISYLFCYVYDLLGRCSRETVVELGLLMETYDSETKFGAYCQAWLSDCHVILGNYSESLALLAPGKSKSVGAIHANKLLSLKLLSGERLNGAELLLIERGTLTPWGEKHLSEIVGHLDVLTREQERRTGLQILVEWAKTSRGQAYQVFLGTFHQTSAHVPCYSFTGNPKAVEFARATIRMAENAIRDAKGIPRVGEGWVSETDLYYQLKEALANACVIHNAKPTWLGKQHLDIFIPEYGIALEYQGPQHDKSVQFFGGKKAFRIAKHRDARKARLCLENNVHLVLVRPGYSLVDVLTEIQIHMGK